MSRLLTAAAVVAVWAGVAAADPAKWTVKEATSPPPKELKEPIRALLSNKSLQVFDEKSKPVCEIWLRKELPAKSGEDVKKGVKYTQITEGTIAGAVRFDQVWKDYRDQSIKPGVFTLRLGFQPMDGNHMGTAPYNDFFMLAPAEHDTTADPLDAKKLFQLSTKAAGSHASVLLLFPAEPSAAATKMVDRGNAHWVLHWKQDVIAGSQKAVLGLGLTLHGKAAE